MIRGFERDTDPSVVGAIPGAEVLSQNRNLTLILIEQSNEHVLGRALARTAWAKESKDFERFDREGHPTDCGPLGPRIGEAEGADFDDGHVTQTVTATTLSPGCRGGANVSRPYPQKP